MSHVTLTIFLNKATLSFLLHGFSDVKFKKVKFQNLEAYNVFDI